MKKLDMPILTEFYKQVHEAFPGVKADWISENGHERGVREIFNGVVPQSLNEFCKGRR